jgi:hypothetical protein
MDELLWAVEQLRVWIASHGGTCQELRREIDGRWFARVVSSDMTWDEKSNLYIFREADLGRFPGEEEEKEEEKASSYDVCPWCGHELKYRDCGCGFSG